MASASAEAGEALVVGGWSPPADAQSHSDRYLARRLDAAGADYKGTAVTTFVLGVLVGAVAWIVAGVLAEHWVVPGGLPRPARWLWLGAGSAALAAAAVRWLLPLIRYRVNLVYAARVIERENPDLHNDLVNTVLVKARPEGSAAVVVRQLEKRAAKRLADVPLEGVIDRTHAIRLALALAALVALACLYQVAAPKSLLVSAARLIAPWAGIAAPSRVQLETPRLHWRMPGGAADPQAIEALDEARRVAVDRGTATLVRGRQLVIASAIRGLRSGETPLVHAVPLGDDGAPDAAAPPWQVAMTRGAGAGGEGKVFTAFLPDATRGLENSIAISIAAGDARGEPVKVTVIDAPSLLVREVRYDYPAYLGRQPETLAWQGDVRAPEDTQVTLVAECNQPLDAAWIDFGCDGSRDLKMRVGANDLARAAVTFALRMNADRTAPEHPSYRLVFQPRGTPEGGREAVITEPIEHRIEVVADLAPEVSILAPTQSPLAVPLDAPVTVEVRALDPDHALSKVALEARLAGGSTTTIPILEKPREGPFTGKGRIQVGRIPGAHGGAVIEYRAVAADNRPQPNVSVTPWQELKLDAAAPPPPQEREPDLPADAADRRPPDRDPGQRERNDADDPGEDGQPRDGGQDEGRDEGRQGDAGQRGPRQDGGDDRQAGEGRPAGDRPPQDPGRDARDRQPGEQGDEDAAPENGQPQPPGREGDAQEGANPDAERGAGEGQRRQAGEGREGNDGQPGEQGEPQPGRGRQGERQGDGGAGGDRDEGAKGQGANADGRDRQDREGGDRRPGDQGRGQEAHDRDPVAADGTNDGEAMERILEHRRQADAEQGAGEQGAGEKGAGEKGAGEKGAGEKGAGEQGAGEKGVGEKGAGEKGAGEKGAGEKGAGEKGAGEKGAGEKGAGEKGAGEKGAGEKGAGEKGAGEKGAGEKGAGEKGAGEKGAGEQGAGEQGAGEKGAGEKGAGEKGAGEKGAGEKGAGEKGAGGPFQQSADGEAGGPGAAAKPKGEPGATSSPAGSGGWSEAGGPPRNAGAAPEGDAPDREAEWGEQNTDHARNAADLALRTLKDDLDAGRTDLLDELGWTREEARAFLQRWESMKSLEGSGDASKRGTFDKALRSLGLRGDGVRSRRDVPSDVKGGQAEGRRTRPPSEYLEQFKAYTQGTAGE